MQGFFFLFARENVCVDEAARKPFGGRLKSGNFSRLNKSSLWGTVFPGAIRMRTQTSLHYVTTALEIPALGEKPPRPPAEAPLACSDAFLSALSPSLFIPLILFSTPLLAFNPTLPLSFLFDAIRPLKLLRLSPPFGAHSLPSAVPCHTFFQSSSMKALVGPGSL